MADWIGGSNFKGRYKGHGGKCIGCGTEVGECDCQWLACPQCGELIYIGKGDELNEHYTCYRGCGYSTVREQ